jgi:ABC-type lipoprotein release transport system permease subunit
MLTSLLTDLLIAGRSLAQHTRRSMLLGAAIAAVTGLLILLVGLSVGARESMMRSATTLMSGHVNIGGFYKVTAGQAAPVVTGYKQVMADAKAALPDIDYVVQRGRGWAKLVSDSGSQQVGVGGIDIDTEPGFKKVVKVMSGKMDDLAKPGSVLLFQSQAEKLDVKVGDSLTFSAPTTRGVNNTIDVKVVAIAENIGLLSSFNVYVPVQTLRDLYQLNTDATGVLYVYLKDPELAQKDAALLRDALEKKGHRLLDPDPQPFWMKFPSVTREEWTGQKLDVTTWSEELGFLAYIINGLDFMSGLLISILIVIVVIGIMNTMWIAIRERTREIGTLRAIGMQRFRVLRMFLIEAGLLGFLGTLAGAVGGALIAGALNGAGIALPPALRFFLISDHLHVAVHFTHVLVAGLVVSTVTMLAAFYPALRASRLQPVTAMSHVG